MDKVKLDKFEKELFVSMFESAWHDVEILLVLILMSWEDIFDISINCFFTAGLGTFVYDLENDNNYYCLLFITLYITIY